MTRNFTADCFQLKEVKRLCEPRGQSPRADAGTWMEGDPTPGGVLGCHKCTLTQVN